jgi:hypothetical protein
MKLFLTKLRISSALDSGKPLSESLRQKIAAEPELRHFVRQSKAFAADLPPPANDSALHNDIMRAVRAAAREEQSRPAPIFAWLTATATVAGIVVISLWIGRPVPPLTAQIPMDAPQAVLEMSQKAQSTVPDAMIAPLTNEWAKVNRDVQNTGAILAASFPF